MDVQTPEFCLGAGAIEVLILDLADGAAIAGIGIVRAEAGDVEAVGASADLFVGGKADLQRCMAAALCQKGSCSSEDLGDARLVIGPQQGGVFPAPRLPSTQLSIAC